jgi:ribosomal protein L11 methyltransferase
VLWDRALVTGLYPAGTETERVLDEIARRCGMAALPPHRATPLPDRDWERAWMERFQPIPFGERLWVVPSWIEPPDPQATNIVIDPGLAFGTGTHATTSMCLEWLAAHSPSGLEVIDYGCGSGILAIAAARLGAARVRAVDIDMRAIDVAADNAARNNVAEIVRCGPPSLADGEPADLVIANILARPLIELAGRISAIVRPAGTLLLTGITHAQRAEVAAAYAPAFRFDSVGRGEWLLLAGARAT